MKRAVQLSPAARAAAMALYARGREDKRVASDRDWLAQIRIGESEFAAWVDDMRAVFPGSAVRYVADGKRSVGKPVEHRALEAGGIGVAVQASASHKGKRK